MKRKELSCQSKITFKVFFAVRGGLSLQRSGIYPPTRTAVSKPYSQPMPMIVRDSVRAYVWRDKIMAPACFVVKRHSWK